MQIQIQHLDTLDRLNPPAKPCKSNLTEKEYPSARSLK
ncbi:hypothetical protein SOHN41_01356 [Shewanella sp. HN-41]|nr:hypothetical protein SOHN41_01356 [Shewanella sp. HN-41]